MRSLFCLEAWAEDARTLLDAMGDELDAAGTGSDTTERFRYLFGMEIAIVRHLQLDPLLPVELVPDRWPGRALRETYRRFDGVFKQRMNNAFR
jgi:phenylacetic acid degradation operon negative regulatory protein